MNSLELISQGPDHVLQTSFHPKHAMSPDQKTILLAEDDDDLRLVMECSLSSMGYLVVACANAHLASAAFHTHAIDVLVTGFEMPGKSGMELARELTATQPSLPVMVITGSMPSAEMLREMIERQWIYMSKPSNLSVVERVLKKLVTADFSLAA